MPITERQELILNKIIQEYIHSAQPVSSQLLEKKYDFGVCPATIRNEMQKLTEKGFLFQPHTSAGRVPSDKGYRFFVDDLIEDGIFDKDFDFGIEDWIEGAVKDTVKFIQSPERSDGWRRMNVLRLLTKNLALASSNLAIGYLSDENIFWKEGWEEVLEEPEFEERQLISNFAQLLKNFEKEPGKIKINSGIKIYIGKESPFPKAKDFSIICARCHFPEEEGVVSLLGPKRMAYDKNIGLINSLVNLLENY